MIGQLEKGENTTHSIDTRIGFTVSQIIRDFFKQNNQNILVYICETKDNKQHARFRKFNNWFSMYHQDQSFLKLEDTLVDSKNNLVPISVIFKKTNPYCHQIVDAFVAIFKLKK